MAKPRFFLLGFVFLLIAAGPGFSQTVSIVSGQGQVSCSFFCDPFTPLVVAVKDASGAPVPFARVTWNVSSNPLSAASLTGGLQTVDTFTDATGQASVGFSQPISIVAPFLTHVQAAVTATAGASTVTFYETSAVYEGGASRVRASLEQPTVGSLLTGQSGQTLPGAVRVAVIGGNDRVANVAVRLEPIEGAAGATAKCATAPGQPDGVVLTDATGFATCDVQLGAGVGAGQFRVVIGENFRVGPIHLEVRRGLPCIMRVVGGNNQAGNAGQTLPAPLVALVTDCGGNPLDGVPVAWTVTRGSGTLTGTRTSSDPNGRVSTNLTLGAVAGPVDVTVAVPSGTQTANNQPVSVTFNATVNLVISQLQKVSGDLQEAAQNTAFAQPLIVQVNNQGVPVAGAGVSFAVASGSGTVGTATAITNAQGQASTTVTAGPTVGPLVVTATVGSFSQQFTLTVRPPAPVNVTFENGAGFQRDFIAPCGIATIRGNGIATGIQGVVVGNYVGPLPILLGGVSVQFGNSFAPIYNIANVGGQESVTVQVPCETTPGTVPVTIRVGTSSGQYSARVQAAAPGIFESAMSDGRRRAVIVKPDGTFATLENPARKGEIVRMYVTGLGPVSPAVGTNSTGIPDSESMVPNLGNIVVGVNNGGVRVVSAKYARGLIGVYEVAFEVPAEVPSGNLPLAIAVYQGSDLLFGNPSAIPVQ